VRVLFPPRQWPVGDRPENNDSMVLRVSYLDSSILLEGDAEKKVERYIAETERPQATLLKVGHHGSANATTPELMAVAKPQFALISIGAGNSFGLPRMETLARLGAAGVRVYRTDLNARSRSCLTAAQSRLLRRIFNNFDLGRLVVVERRLTILSN
jgi:competence protein ComEC